MANFTALAAARHWYGERHGVDVEEAGLAALPPIPVLTGGHLHPSAAKSLTMLGIGRAQVRTFVRDGAGRMDLDALGRALADLHGTPAIVAVTAGEPNAADVDPIAKVADLAEEHGAWLHVDGAFGLFGRVTPESGDLLDGVDRAHSVIADGHKWLNVPYDCGFAFVQRSVLLPKAFAAGAAYLPALDDPSGRTSATTGPRCPGARGRWRSGRRFARTDAPGIARWSSATSRWRGARRGRGCRARLELLRRVPLNIVCFRYRPRPRRDEAGWTSSTRGSARPSWTTAASTSGRRLRRQGRVPARDRELADDEPDVRLVVDVIRELGEHAVAG